MINVKIVAVGNLKEQYLKDACGEYIKRLKRYCNISVKELNESKLSDKASPKDIQKALETEGKAILRECRGYLIAMCIEGKQLSSVDFSNKLMSAATAGGSSGPFVIGSSCGISDEVKRTADLKLSMSEMTFPHQLARVMLTEQIYRAFQIASNGKYHK